MRFSTGRTRPPAFRVTEAGNPKKAMLFLKTLQSPLTLIPFGAASGYIPAMNITQDYSPFKWSLSGLQYIWR
jgi:hypothetical protein